MTSHPPKAGWRKRASLRPALTRLVTMGTAATLGVVVYLASTSLPYLATSPTTDPLFGELNQCLMDAVPVPRVGFAVAAEGSRAAAYSGSVLAICTRSPGAPDGGARSSVREFELEGISAAAFDFGGTLWLSTERKSEGEPKLWRVGEGEPERVGDFAPIALVGHAHGVAALDATGRLVSLSAEGEALGIAQLPSAPTFGAQLSTNAGGNLVAVVAGTGLFVFQAANLVKAFAEGPCDVEFLWWLEDADRALVSCGPKGSWALELRLPGGQREVAPAKQRSFSTLVPRLGAYVQPCEHLPCSASRPGLESGR